MNSDEILGLIKVCNMCVLGITENNVPYIVPVNYKSEFRDQTLLIKIKSKNYGMKVRYMKNNNNVCVHFQRKTKNIIESITGFGNACIDKNKEANINIIIKKISGRKYYIN